MKSIPLSLVLVLALTMPALAAPNPNPFVPQRPGSIREGVAPVDCGAPRRWVDGIADVMQMNSYTCGVASFQAVAMRYGHWGYQEEWIKELGTTPAQGTHPERIVRCLKRLGLDAAIEENMRLEDLFRHIDAGHAVIVDFQAWGEPSGKDYSKEWEDGHYSLAVGYNDTHLFIEDPCILGSVGTLKHADFVSRWHDYELEGQKRREYRHMAIVVKTPARPVPKFVPIE